MKRKFAAFLVALLGLTMFSFASAHQHESYEIGGIEYQFTVGSLNEPIAVDDKTGVELEVTMGEGHDHEDTANLKPVTGLEKTLKVELIAGDKKKVLDLKPAFGSPGAYSAPFYPTVQTTYTYRLFGTINEVPVDFSFSCLPAGTTASEETTRTQISDKVFRVSKSGSFGCPTAKETLGFPEASHANVDLAQKVSALENKKPEKSSNAFGIIALALSVIALAVSAKKSSINKI